MGTLCSKSSTIQVVECIHQLQDVEKTLELLINKYGTQIKNEQRLARTKMHQKSDCMRHVRTIHMIRHHKHNMENRLNACMNKRYQLESLNVTKMHIKAVQSTTRTYRQFLDEHDIEKVERLQDTLTEMIEDACEINDTISSQQNAFEIDDDEIEREYNSICAEIQLPIAPTEFPSLIPEKTQSSLERSEDANPELVPLTAH